MSDEHIVDQDDLKKSIELWNELKETDWFKERPLNVKQLYDKYPPWKFYTDKDGKSAYRVYGIAERADGKLVLETAHAMFIIHPNKKIFQHLN